MTTEFSMKAIVQSGFGRPDEVLAVAETERPPTGPDKILVRVHSSGIAKGTWLITRGIPYIARPSYGIRSPKVAIAGLQFSGTVEEVGGEVSGFAVGDAVFGFGAGLAEFVSAPVGALVVKPASISFEQAAAAPISGLAALQAIRDAGRVGPGNRVLVIGASGSVGSFAVQVAKAYGAEVTGVASTRNLGMLLQLGADCALDYTREDPTEGKTKYDVVVDIAGNRPVRRLRNALEPNGTLVIVGGTGGRWTMGFERTIGGMLLGLFTRQRIVGLLSTSSQKDLAELANLMASGKVRPVVQPPYPWSRAAEAVESVGIGRGAGTAVVSLQSLLNDDDK